LLLFDLDMRKLLMPLFHRGELLLLIHRRALAELARSHGIESVGCRAFDRLILRGLLLRVLLGGGCLLRNDLDFWLGLGFRLGLDFGLGNESYDFGLSNASYRRRLLHARLAIAVACK